MPFRNIQQGLTDTTHTVRLAKNLEKSKGIVKVPNRKRGKCCQEQRYSQLRSFMTRLTLAVLCPKARGCKTFTKYGRKQKLEKELAV